mgnify:FL=1
MDSLSENYREKWDAMRREYDAKADRLSAERRMEYNKAFDDMGAELDAAGDWTEAAWNEFTAKAYRKWQEFAIDMQD